MARLAIPATAAAEASKAQRARARILEVATAGDDTTTGDRPSTPSGGSRSSAYGLFVIPGPAEPGAADGTTFAMS